MKSLLVFAVVCSVIAVSIAKETYTTKWDGINLDSILRSDRLLSNYMNCLMNRGSCTPDGKDLKKILPDSLANDCLKCTENQKNGSTKVIKHLRKNKPVWWKELTEKYDPEGSYISRHPELEEQV